MASPPAFRIAEDMVTTESSHLLKKTFPKYAPQNIKLSHVQTSLG